MNRMTNRGQGSMAMIPGGALGKAKFALGSGRPDEAERIARKQLEKDPANANARVILAQALLQQRQVDDAILEARRATSQQSTNVEAQMILASALLQKNNIIGRVSAEAERAAARAVQLQPKSARTHVQLAEVYAAKKDMANAKAEVDRAIELEPRLAPAHLMRAMISFQNRDPQGAITASDAALRNDRTLTQAEFIKANAYVDLKQYDDALAALDDVARQNPLMAGPQVDILRGRIYFKQRKVRQSYAIYREAQAQNPRLKFLAPVIAGVNMVLMGFFGQSAQYAWIGVLLALVLLILFGVHFIPVVGGWIVAVLVLAIVAVVALRCGSPGSRAYSSSRNESGVEHIHGCGCRNHGYLARAVYHQSDSRESASRRPEMAKSGMGCGCGHSGHRRQCPHSVAAAALLRQNCWVFPAKRTLVMFTLLSFVVHALHVDV